ncbi:MAG: Nre family DNA repair protein [Nitrososphaeria archaeon]|nr:Nre family DNA repair protein [Nitrososphaeria archaeon]
MKKNDIILPDSVRKELEDTGISLRGKFSSICIYCRGGRNLCGKAVCPITLKAVALLKISKPIKVQNIYGSSPPSVFVGRSGYPKVYAGPMVPPFSGDTVLMDLPEAWIGTPLEKIVEYRYTLLRGKSLVSVDEAWKGSRLIDALHELALSEKPVDSEVEFEKPPSGNIYLDDNSQPFGPSAPMKKFKVYSISSSNRKIEKYYYDTDLLSYKAVWELYHSGVEVSRIQRAFSVGMFGIKKNRKLVPTRWSITAVDSIISAQLIERIKYYSTIDKYLVYNYNYMSNIFAALLFPQKWSFEWMEAWFPGTFWNQNTLQVDVGGDFEGYYGRTTYPSIGGCYFASRLATGEFLDKIRRQAKALVLREIHPEFPLPLGVWFVRECVRRMFAQKPKVFEDLKSALEGLSNTLTVPLKKWIEKSEILRESLFQRKITEY